MRSKVWIGVLFSVFALPAIAAAHNVGHVFLPDGACLEVGSVKEAPLVGPDGTQLDLVPGTANPPRDEYGTSFVGYWGNTPILPGRCPVVTATSAGPATTSVATMVGSANAAAKPSAPSRRARSVGLWVSFGLRKES
jgi:hypothetical protein